MFSPQSKRRKTGAESEVRVDASNTMDPSPSVNENLRAARHHVSYQSPTKASLARFNPHLLRPAQKELETQDGRDMGRAPARESSDQGTASSFPTSGSLRSFVLGGRGQGDLAHFTGDIGMLRRTRQDTTLRDQPMQEEDADAEPELPLTPSQRAQLVQASSSPPPSSPSGRVQQRRRGKSQDMRRSSPPVKRLDNGRKESATSSAMREDQTPAIGQQSIPHILISARDAASLRQRLDSQLQELREGMKLLETELQSGNLMRTQQRKSISEAERINELMLLLTRPTSSGPRHSLATRTLATSETVSFLLPFASSRIRHQQRAYTNTESATETTESNDDVGELEPDINLVPVNSLFGSLSLHGHISTRIDARPDPNSSKDSVTQVQNITLSAPAPLPPSVYRTAIRVISRLPFEKVERVELSSPSVSLERYPELKAWLFAVLRNDKHGLNASDIFWTLNRHWDCVIERARIWSELENLQTVTRAQGSEPPYAYDPKASKIASSRATWNMHLPVSKEEVPQLLKHLTRTSMQLSLGNTRDEGPSEGRRVQLVVRYKLELNTPCCPEPDVDISLRGIPAKAQVGLKRLFRRLEPEMGLLRAIDCVVRVFVSSIP